MTSAMPLSTNPGFVDHIAASIPEHIAEGLKAIGPVIALGPTSALYAPLHELDPKPQAVVARDISYGTHERHLLDVFISGQCRDSRPVLIFIHGGGFVGGNKSGPATPFYDNVMYWAAKHGMVGVNATYRLAPTHQWPCVQEDLHSITQWVDTHIASYGGDPRRVFLVGHSAGAAHVAQYLAEFQADAHKKTGICGGLLVSGIFDPSKFAEQQMVQSYFGTDAAALAQRNSTSALAKTGIPLFLAYAQLDPPAFKTQTLEAAKQLRQAGCQVRCIELVGHNHLSAVYAVGTNDSSLSAAWLEFIKRNQRVVPA